MMFVSVEEGQFIDISDQCEYSWDVPPTVVAGSFPDSLVSPELHDYFEFQAPLSAAGNVGVLDVLLPETFLCFPIVYISSQVGTDDAIRRVLFSRIDTNYDGGNLSGGVVLNEWEAGEFSSYGSIGNGFMTPVFANKFRFNFYAGGAGTFNFRVRTLRVVSVLL